MVQVYTCACAGMQSTPASWTNFEPVVTMIPNRTTGTMAHRRPWRSGRFNACHQCVIHSLTMGFTFMSFCCFEWVWYFHAQVSKCAVFHSESFMLSVFRINVTTLVGHSFFLRLLFGVVLQATPKISVALRCQDFVFNFTYIYMYYGTLGCILLCPLSCISTTCAVAKNFSSFANFYLTSVSLQRWRTSCSAT